MLKCDDNLWEDNWRYWALKGQVVSFMSWLWVLNFVDMVFGTVLVQQPVFGSVFGVGVDLQIIDEFNLVVKLGLF